MAQISSKVYLSAAFLLLTAAGFFISIEYSRAPERRGQHGNGPKSSERSVNGEPRLRTSKFSSPESRVLSPNFLDNKNTDFTSEQIVEARLFFREKRIFQCIEILKEMPDSNLRTVLVRVLGERISLLENEDEVSELVLALSDIEKGNEAISIIGFKNTFSLAWVKNLYSQMPSDSEITQDFLEASIRKWSEKESDNLVNWILGSNSISSRRKEILLSELVANLSRSDNSFQSLRILSKPGVITSINDSLIQSSLKRSYVKDPNLVAAWIDRNSDIEAIQNMADDLIFEWFKEDVVSAAEWIGQIQNEQLRNKALAGYAEALFSVDYGLFEETLKMISDPSLKSNLSSQLTKSSSP